MAHSRSRHPKLWPLLTGTVRYEKTISLYNQGHGEWVNAPILAYLVETPNGRILYDVGCDHSKVNDPKLAAKYFNPDRPDSNMPKVREDQRIPNYLERLGLAVSDIDLVFLGHLHWDHAGGLCDLPNCDVHVHAKELEIAQSGQDHAVFASEIEGSDAWITKSAEYEISPGVHAIETPGHTAGHMSMLIELEHGSPVVLCGDAADLQQNLDERIAPGYCWQDNTAQALASIEKMQRLASDEGAELWPNHDFDFFRKQAAFPDWRD